MQVRNRARAHVVPLSGILSAVALALVFGAALGAIPEAALPPASESLFAAIPHANAVISVFAIGAITIGWRAIRAGDIKRHRLAMGSALVLFAGFLCLYLYRVAHLGPAPFPGPATVESFVYVPTLAIHVLLAVICVPLLIYVVLLAATRPASALAHTNHARIGRVAAALWLLSFTLGLVIYVLLYVIY